MKMHRLLTLAAVLGASVPSAWAQALVQPEIPRDLHGLWWQPADPGWATAIFDHETAMSSTLMLYDHEGKPTWYTAPRLSCYRDAPPWTHTYCDGPMYRVMGSWFGSTFRSSEVTVRQVGEWNGSFLTPLFGGVGPNLERPLYLTYSIDGLTAISEGHKPLEVQPADPKGGDFLWQDGRYSGLWSTPGENGWGVGVFVQNRSLYATLFVHGTDRQPRWYPIVAKMGEFDERLDPVFQGDVYETRGQRFATGRSGSDSVRRVGGASLHFSETPGEPATLSYTIDGVQVNKTIVRQK
jgi:hypothetical protein